MKISFAVIAYNEQRNIINCLLSILELNQLPAQHEIVVVDDGSTDQTAKLVSKFSKEHKTVKLIKSKRNCGRGAARALAIRNCPGKMIATVDADITLPQDWLIKCKQQIKRYDAVSGTPVPDGDVAYIYQRFHLQPKIVSSSTIVNGSNALYKGKIFSEVEFDPQLKEGEDTDFNHQLQALGYKLLRINSLTVEHNEHKSFYGSLKWLYQYGCGATRHLKRFKEIRTPDLSFFAFLGSVFLSIGVYIIHHNPWFLGIPILYIALIALLHLHSKFIFRTHATDLAAFLLGWLTNTTLIASYYAGRLTATLQWQFLDGERSVALQKKHKGMLQ